MTTQTQVDKANETAAKEAAKAQEAKQAAEDAKLTPEERKAKDANDKADDAQAKAVELEAQAASEAVAESTAAEDVKSVSAAVDPNLNIGAHTVQTFANTPANPALAPRLNPEDASIRMELTDSDHPDPAHPKVTYVNHEMVGDYLRAGWRRPVA